MVGICQNDTVGGEKVLHFAKHTEMSMINKILMIIRLCSHRLMTCNYIDCWYTPYELKLHKNDCGFVKSICEYRDIRNNSSAIRQNFLRKAGQ